MAAYDISLLGAQLEFDTTDAFDKYAEKLTDTRFVIAWERNTTVKLLQCFDLNRSTGGITALSTPITFYTGSVSWSTTPPSIVRLSDTSFAVFWTGAGDDGFCRTFQVNAGTGAITNWGAQVEYDTSNGTYPSAVLMANDGTTARILNAWSGDGNDGFTAIFSVNMSTGAIAVTGTPFEFFAADIRHTSLCKISDTKALVAIAGQSARGGYMRVLDVNTSTWAVTAAGATYDTGISSVANNSIEIISDSPLIAVNSLYYDRDFLRPVSINDSTWAIANIGSGANVDFSGSTTGQRTILRIDNEHFIIFYSLSIGGVSETYSIDLSTGATTLIDQQSFIGQAGTRLSAIDMGEGLFVIGYTGAGNDGYVRTLQVELPSSAIFRRRLLI